MDVKTYGQLIHVDGRFGMKLAPHVAVRVKRIFPRARSDRAGIVFIDDTPATARDLEWVLTRWPLKINDQAAARLRSQADQHRETESAVQRILGGDRPTIDLPNTPARAPRDYQLTAADMVLATNRLLLTDDVGLGKSMSGLLVLRDPQTLPALVVTLTHLPKQWLGELQKTFPSMLGHVLRNGAIYDPADRHDGQDPQVIITSYSKLSKWQDHLAGQVRTVIFDEIQELRRSDSDRYRAAQNIASKAAYRMGLTATPIYNYAGEIYTILQVLEPDELGSRDEFLREWSGHIVGFGGNLSVGDAHGLGAYLRDQGLMLHRSRKDVGRELTAPVVVEQPIATDHQVVDDAVRDSLTMAELLIGDAGGWRERGQAAVEMDWRLRQATGVAKARYVADFVKLLLESEERVVLYGWHRDVYDIWLNRLADYKPVLYTGSESAAAKDASKTAFTTGDARILIISLRSGAGLDGLQEACSVAVFGELDWSPGVHEQCIGRLWRDGQEGTVVAYYLVSEAGTDPLMTETLGLKLQQADALRGERANVQIELQSDRVKRLAAAVIDRAKNVPVADADAKEVLW